MNNKEALKKALFVDSFDGVLEIGTKYISEVEKNVIDEWLKGDPSNDDEVLTVLRKYIMLNDGRISLRAGLSETWYKEDFRIVFRFLEGELENDAKTKGNS